MDKKGYIKSVRNVSHEFKRQRCSQAAHFIHRMPSLELACPYTTVVCMMIYSDVLTFT